MLVNDVVHTEMLLSQVPASQLLKKKILTVMLLYYECSRIGSLCLDLSLDLELSCVLISPWMVLSFLGIDLVDKWTICWIAIICLI